MAEQVIGAFQVDEAARAWVSGIEQTPAFLRCDDSVLRRMQHQLRLARASGHAAFVRAPQLLDERRPNGESSSTDGGGQGGVANRTVDHQMLQDVVGGAGRTDRAHRLHLGQLVRRQQCRGAAQAVSHQQRRLPMGGVQPVHRGHQVGHIGSKTGIAQFALAVAQAGEVKAKRRNAALGQRSADAYRGQAVLAAGEAVREYRVGLGPAMFRQLQHPGQFGLGGTGKFNLLAGHFRSPARCVFPATPH